VAILRFRWATAIIIFAASAVACSSPSGPTVSLATAKPALPDTNTVIPSTSQPVTLTVQNAVTTQPTVPVTDTFELATDPAFPTIVATKSVPQSAGGQTSVALDPLPPATYYWRVRATAGGAVVTSAAGTFRIAAVLLAPFAYSPGSGVLIGDLDQPITLVAQNPTMPPSVTVVTDTFDVATDAAFTNILASQSVSQAPGAQTSVTLAPLTPGATYYWRVRAAAPGAIGAASATAMFRIGSALAAGQFRFTIDGSGAGACTNLTSNFAHQFAFDGDVTVNNQTLVFSKPALPSDFTPDLTLRVNIQGHQASGSLVGSAVTTNVPNPMLGYTSLEVFVSNAQSARPATPVSTLGRIDSSGSLSGTFTGYLGVYVPYLDGGVCYATYPWSLGPR
jgi:hypothetical protein